MTMQIYEKPKALDALRLPFLDGLRGWAAVVVVLFHVLCVTFAFGDDSYGYMVWLPLNGTAAVGIFFFLSGFSLSAPFHQNGEWYGLLRLGAGRYLRLAIPVFAASAIMHLAMITGAVQLRPEDWLWGQWFHFQPSLLHLFKSSLFDTFFQFSAETTYIPPLWTLYYEFMATYVVILVLASNINLIFSWIVYIVIFAILFYYKSNMSLFVAGMISCRIYLLMKPRDFWANLSGLLMVAVGQYLLIAFGYNSWENTDRVWLSGVIFVSVGLLAAPFSRRLLSSGVSLALGRWSFPIYLTHMIVLAALSVPLGQYLQARYPGNLFAYSLAATLLIVACLASGALVVPANNLAVKWSRQFGGAVERATRAVISACRGTRRSGGRATVD